MERQTKHTERRPIKALLALTALTLSYLGVRALDIPIGSKPAKYVMFDPREEYDCDRLFGECQIGTDYVLVDDFLGVGGRRVDIGQTQEDGLSITPEDLHSLVGRMDAIITDSTDGRIQLNQVLVGFNQGNRTAEARAGATTCNTNQYPRPYPIGIVLDNKWLPYLANSEELLKQLAVHEGKGHGEWFEKTGNYFFTAAPAQVTEGLADLAVLNYLESKNLSADIYQYKQLNTFLNDPLFKFLPYTGDSGENTLTPYIFSLVFKEIQNQFPTSGSPYKSFSDTVYAAYKVECEKMAAPTDYKPLLAATNYWTDGRLSPNSEQELFDWFVANRINRMFQDPNTVSTTDTLDRVLSARVYPVGNLGPNRFNRFGVNYDTNDRGDFYHNDAYFVAPSGTDLVFEYDPNNVSVNIISNGDLLIYRAEFATGAGLVITNVK